MKAIVSGYGSIGERHHQILSSLGLFESVDVISSRASSLNLKSGRAFPCVSEVNCIEQYSYAVVSSGTSDHLKDYLALRNANPQSTILIEKPLGCDLEFAGIGDEKCFVSYNLRFHRGVKEILSWMKHESVLHADFVVGQNLNQWNKARHYSEMYRSSRKLGGGALLDLSHELDLACFLFPKLRLHAVMMRNSGLHEIDVEDQAEILAQSGSGGLIRIHMDTLDHGSIRTYRFQGRESTLKCDLLNNKASIFSRDGHFSTKSWDESYDHSIESLHLDLLQNNGTNSVCSLMEAIDLQKLIVQCREMNSVIDPGF